ncbi:MAG: DUF1045 domain-containing protein [Pseudomonadota bacterium]
MVAQEGSLADYRRFALYYAPPEGSALANFGAAWLGWDAQTGRVVPHPDVAVPVAEVTQTPRKYGFHGTLKPPFRLAAGTDAAMLMDVAARFAARARPFRAPPPRLRRIGPFLALTTQAPALSAHAAALVRVFEPFRAAPMPAELDRRRAVGVDAGQEALLRQWGYPHVMRNFRFHLTLTGALPADRLAPIEQALVPLLTPLIADPLPVRELCVFGERPDGRFRVVRRFPFGGGL